MPYTSHSYRKNTHQSSRDVRDPRIHLAVLACTVFAALIIARLFFLMVLQHDFYVALAAGAQEISTQIFSERGKVFIQDSRTKEEYPLAINRRYYLMFADTREIRDDATANDVANKLASALHYDDERKLAVYLMLNKRTDAYEPIEPKLDESMYQTIKGMSLPGIAFVAKSYRYYPEGSLAAHVIGFVGKTEKGDDVGRYGIEGYWNKELAGTGGIFEGLRSAGGRWIPLVGKLFEPAKNGVDLLLTLDRTLEFQACEKLRNAMTEFQATSAALIIMDPRTGAIRAMCSSPEFDPNAYNKVAAVDVYNNTSIFTPYEPGSVFKPLTMAAAINEGAVAPDTTFVDSGTRDVGCKTSIHNASNKAYGFQTMTGVLENSINTGAVFAVEKLGKKLFRQYVNDFGFGVKDGIELDTEGAGDLSSLLHEGKKEGLDCFSATAAFGQGITVTPLQMITAISAIANGGVLMKPYIVDEKRYADGRVERTEPIQIRRVLRARTSSLVSAMMASVADRGQSRNARIDGYYVAGKTGTAQIAGPGGYSEDTNHTFVGFAPVDDPRFAMIIKFEKPQRNFADSTAAPLFADIGKFILSYYQVPPGR